MDLDFDFDDSFDRFLSDNNNILFRKLDNALGKTIPETPAKVPATKPIDKTKLIPRSVKKNHRLPGRKAPAPVQISVPEIIPKPTALQQKDAVRQVVVHMSSHVHELLKNELQNLEPEIRFNYTEFEQSKENIFFCPYLYWKPMPKLKELLENSSCTTNYNSPTFNQMMFFVTPQNLHRNVHKYVKELSQTEDASIEDDSFIDILDIIKKFSTDLNRCSQITVIIHRLGEYLKAQRNRANRQFRRQMNQFMSNNDDQQQPQQRKKTQKNKESPDDECDNLIELTIENVDMFLIDLGMRFLHEFGGIGSANITPIIVDSLQEVVELIFRYSRSLSEQLFRNDRRGDAGSDIYMIQNKITAMELDESRGRHDAEKVWLKQLQQMPSMKASVSKAIVEHFPTPYSLWSRLQNSNNPVGLLSKIGQGTAGKVGVDLAEKIYVFMTGNLPGEVLKTATSART